MSLNRKVAWLALVCIAALVLLIALSVWSSPAPSLTIAHGDTRAVVSADRAWVLLPNDCLQIRWDYEGNLPIYVDGRAWHESGEQAFCPTIFAPSPLIELTNHQEGVYLGDTLDTHYLPDFLVNLIAVAGLGLFPLLAAYYLWTNNLHARPSLRTMLIAAFALCFCIALLRLMGRPLTIDGIISLMRGLFRAPGWQLFGAALALTLYLSLAIDGAWRGIRQRRYDDFIVVGGFSLFVVLLYLPFGLDAIGHWESWNILAYFEGMSWRIWDIQLISRPWSFVLQRFAYSVDSESFFVVINLVYALLLWGRLIALYGLLRALAVRRLYSFLVCMLFAVYPVDPALMSLRSMPLQFALLTFLTALWLAIQHQRKAKRTRMLGIWLALALGIFTHEIAYALILIIPLFWWRGHPKKKLQNINLTLIWYLIPAFKIAYHIPLLLTRQSFYKSYMIYNRDATPAETLLANVAQNTFEVYRHAFAVGWGEALDSLRHLAWLPLGILMTALVTGIALYLWFRDDERRMPNNRQIGWSIVIALLLILPSIGVLIWLPGFGSDLWRLNVFVPIAAAIAVFSIVILLTSPIKAHKPRNLVITGICVTLLLPSTMRLILQHEHFVNSADNKAWVLAQIVQLAPQMEERARVLVLSDMPLEAFEKKHIEELKSKMLGSALYILHRGQASSKAFLCFSEQDCAAPPEWYGPLADADTIVFTLDEDLNLRLLERPEKRLKAFADLDYDAAGLFDSNAPIPSRAMTMLGAAIKER